MSDYRPFETWAELIQLYRRAITEPPVSFHDQGQDDAWWFSAAALKKHSSWMLDNMPDIKAEPDKFHRWLGFVQAIMMITHVYTLDQLREQVRMVK